MGAEGKGRLIYYGLTFMLPLFGLNWDAGVSQNGMHSVWHDIISVWRSVDSWSGVVPDLCMVSLGGCCQWTGVVSAVADLLTWTLFSSC